MSETKLQQNNDTFILKHAIQTLRVTWNNAYSPFKNLLLEIHFLLLFFGEK